MADYFTSALAPNQIELMDSIIDATPNLSVITQIELLCWQTDSSTEQKVRDFIGESIILEIEPDVILECVNLRRSRKIKTPDAIIAATALAFDLILVTNNEKDFSNIKGLKLLNPNKI